MPYRFPWRLYQFTFPLAAVHEGSNFSTSSLTHVICFTYVCVYVYLMIATIMDVKWYLIVVLICIFLMISVSFHVLVYLFRRNVYSSVWLIFFNFELEGFFLCVR